MLRNSERRTGKMLLVLVDIALIHLGYITASLLLDSAASPLGNAQSVTYIAALTCSVLYLFGFYSGLKRKGFTHLIYIILFSITITAFLSILGGSYYLMHDLSLEIVLTASLIHIPLLIASRLVFWQTIKGLHGKKKVLIIANDETGGIALADKLRSHYKGWYIANGLFLASGENRLGDYLNDIDVVLISPLIDEKQRTRLVSLCVKYEKEILIVPQFFDLFLQGSVQQQVDDMLVLSIPAVKSTIVNRWVKRAFDLVGSFILVLAASPVMILLWVLIRLTSKGPALFKQERLGINGKPYLIYKFRSMVQDAEKETGPVLATERDSRITTIGRWMRAARLDELPQLYNVVKGEMSLVGPRPERKFFCDQFQREMEEYSYRMTVKPGLTGLAQVMAKYTTTAEDKLRFDLIYIRHYSLGSDIKIVLQTIRILFQRGQAAGTGEINNQKETEVIPVTRI
ncbi:sugar transferase [Sporosarcina jeotgali]|uniref:Sugar transferase n=1 Tax=Sporosarcina jeotgali TaxID=3020056 RepID=A0ABZ0L014_9BACL|nr:sugar transferase [Sporosarcina sp. B2O-1]WOV84514.1 sugar transferase [Sporosarcina sp. B2O-1]